MVRVPFIGRLHLREYLSLLASFVLIGLEILVRVVTLALPAPITRFFYNSSRNLFNYLSSPQGRRSRNKKKAVVASIAQASDFVELCELYGYYAEEHIVQTGDGYLLGLHRLGWRHGETDKRVNGGEGSIQKKVVYLHHGLMMNSDVWVCITEKERCLPFMLVDRGYDVWFGNNRGNKYSKKSIHCPPTEIRFWDFSIDEFAFHDIPNSIEYILSTTKRSSLSYIGFSQGTAQAFATLSIHPTLNDKVDVFIALAPAMSPTGITHGIVDSFIRTSPEVLFLGFGRRSMLSSATMWQAILYPPIFVRLIDISLSFLFSWHTRNITAHQKLAAYPHLYSFTSTKSVVHWFQIMRNATFQMYDDEVQGPLSLAKGRKYYKVAKFPTRNIKTPIVLVYGGSDSLVDIGVMLKELPKHTVATEVPHYEHLDFLWASDVDTWVFPHVMEALESYAGPAGEKDSVASPKAPNMSSSVGQLPTYSEDERANIGEATAKSNVEPTGPDEVTTPARAYFGTDLQSDRTPSRPTTPTPTARTNKPRVSSPSTHPQASPSASVSHATRQTSTSRPEGWWSSDEVGGTETSTPAKSPTHQSTPSGGSAEIATGTSASFGARGISLGAAKAAGGVVSPGGAVAFKADSSDGGEARGKRRGGRKRGI